MTTEQYQIGYEEGYQEGWNAAMGETPLYTALSAAPADPLTISPLEEQQMFDDWCPYRGNPDPRTVWAAAIEAVNGMQLCAASPTPPAEQQAKKPNVVLELPDGDDRVAKVFFSEMKGDTLHLCITVTEQADKAAPLNDEVLEDAMRFRELYRMTALLVTPAGNAYQDAMKSEMAVAFEEAGSDLTKISIEQYRRVIDAGFAAAALAAQGSQQC